MIQKKIHGGIPMNKRNLIIIFTAIITLGIIYFFISSLNDDTNHKQADQHSARTPPSYVPKENLILKPSLSKIFSLAKQGEIIDSNIVVGKTTVENVRKTLGEPDETSDTVVGHFLNYPSYYIDIGITDSIVYDIRSSQNVYKKFDLDTIQSYKNPDDIRYYQDADHDQMILVYELSNDYILKWIFPNPSDHLDNPNIDHISLTKNLHGDSVNDEDTDKSNDLNDVHMSLDEKIGQMIFSGVNGKEMTTETKNIIQKYHVGGIILFGNNIESNTQTVNFLNDIKSANARNPYPLFLGVDEEGGSVTRVPAEMESLPTNHEIGKLNEPEISFKVGTILGEQMKNLGFNLNFAPVLDVNSNPDNPVIGDRSFGDNPNIVTKLGIETMKGMQNEKIISVIKHFPGHGDTNEDSHVELPKLNKNYKNLSETELVPFKKAISEGADMNMIAHILLPKIDPTYPASMSKEVITSILRNDYDFDGVVITDDLTMDAITDHYHIADAAVQAVKSGGDLLLLAHNPSLIGDVFDKLKTAVENGEIDEARIDESINRIAHLKTKYQLSDEKTSLPDSQSIHFINQKVKEIWQEISQ